MPAPNGHGPMPRQVDERALLRADHVRQQKHHDERDHDEVEITEARAVQRARFDCAQPLPLGVHGAGR